jgi:hypothetical protein
MEKEVFIDFAPHYLAAQASLKALQHAMLGRQYKDAKEATLEAITELKLAYNAILHEEETTPR